MENENGYDEYVKAFRMGKQAATDEKDYEKENPFTPHTKCWRGWRDAYRMRKRGRI